MLKFYPGVTDYDFDIIKVGLKTDIQLVENYIKKITPRQIFHLLDMN